MRKRSSVRSGKKSFKRLFAGVILILIICVSFGAFFVSYMKNQAQTILYTSIIKVLRSIRATHFGILLKIQWLMNTVLLQNTYRSSRIWIICILMIFRLDRIWSLHTMIQLTLSDSLWNMWSTFKVTYIFILVSIYIPMYWYNIYTHLKRPNRRKTAFEIP